MKLTTVFLAGALLSSSVALASAARAEIDPAVHEKCASVADYAGCVKANTVGVVDADKEECNPTEPKWCRASAGLDRFGLPKIVGWLYQDKGASIQYVNPKMKVVPHKGDSARYVATQSSIHSFDPGSAGTPGRMQTFGGGRTTCNTYGAYGRGVTSCYTTPPVQTFIPGSAGRPAGARVSSGVMIYDCKQGEGAVYEDGKKVKGWSRVEAGSSIREACAAPEKLEVLNMSL
jgi:hypothetical protein